MPSFTPDRIIERLSQTPPIWIVVWVGLVVLTVALLVLMRTQWGQSRPMRKCAVLSLLAHVLLICFATTIRIVHSTSEGAAQPTMHVTIVDGEWIEDETPDTKNEPSDETIDQEAQPWDPQPGGPVAEPPIAPLERPKLEPPPLATLPPSELAAMRPLVAVEPAHIRAEEAARTHREPLPVHAPLTGNKGEALSQQSQPDLLPSPTEFVQSTSSLYRYRTVTARRQMARRSGGSGETEAAVEYALTWLARSQSDDGRWTAALHGAGRERAVLGHDRRGAGVGADTGVTGLALLAFLGAGHTHRHGQHRDTVARGIEFLIDAQVGDGNLAGRATLYARTYCHAMATFALAEACAMTGDERLKGPVRQAVRYSIATQNRTVGGWRYRPGEQGDTSQLGWQVMALRSAQRAGLPIPNSTWQGVSRFLSHVTSGTYGGLAAYRPGTRPSRTMTSEAAYCRHLIDAGRANQGTRLHSIMALGQDRSGQAKRSGEEAARYVLSELPGESRTNLYYWYYASLFLHARSEESESARGDWTRWNDALKPTLLQKQHRHGPFEGSWPPDTVWGGYGGRVYSTAMAALCLEVYYRYAAAEDLIAGSPQDSLYR